MHPGSGRFQGRPLHRSLNTLTAQFLAWCTRHGSIQGARPCRSSHHYAAQGLDGEQTAQGHPCAGCHRSPPPQQAGGRPPRTLSAAAWADASVELA